MQNKISGAEWRIMQVLWESGKAVTSAEIVECIKEESSRSPRTIKTLLQRLVAKGFVIATASDADSRVYYYYPRVSEDECIKKENRDFISHYYKDDICGMLVRFIGDNDLSETQIKELTALLNEKLENSP